jgi:trans-aconitate 2-methyltransferase
VNAAVQWNPADYTASSFQRLPHARREEFIREALDHYLAAVPPDAAGRTHVAMVRLEVEAVRV